MTNGLNWKEQLHWELYKQYLSSGDSNIYECYRLSKLATEQFINNLAADAREELEGSGWKEHNFQAMADSYQERWSNQRNSDCYQAVERALAGKTLDH